MDAFNMGCIQTSQIEDYHNKMFRRNCDILKRFDLMPDVLNENKKKELNFCADCLKKWNASSATNTLEACTRTFMDTISDIERKMQLLSELEKSKLAISNCMSLYKSMERAMSQNEKSILSIRNSLLNHKTEKIDLQMNDFNIPEKKGYLMFDRLNELIKQSDENEKVIEELKQEIKNRKKKSDM